MAILGPSNNSYPATAEEVGYKNSESGIVFSEIRWFFTNACIYIWYLIKILFNRAERFEELACKRLDFLREEVFPKQLLVFLRSPIWHRRPLVKEILVESSQICAILAENPASDEMLRMIYDLEYKGSSRIDQWFWSSLPGKALRDRLEFCSNWIYEKFVIPAIKTNGRIVDFGGSSAAYAIKALKGADVPSIQGFVWDTIDCDLESLKIGEKRAEEAGLFSVTNFREGNFMSRKSVLGRAQFGVLIGVLCGMDKRTAVFCLEKIKLHLAVDAELIVATLSSRAFPEDPFMFRVLCNVLGWKLRPKTEEEVKDIFQTAGWQIIGDIMSERTGEDGESVPGQYHIVHAKIAI